MMKRGIIYCCFWLFAFSAQAQTATWEDMSKEGMAKVFEQMSNWFKNTTNYSVVVTHASYETHTTTLPFEKSVGYFKKEKDNYHSFLLDIHSIQNAQYKIVLDTANKVMMIANIDKSIWNAYTLEDYKFILKTSKECKIMRLNTDKKYQIAYNEGHPLERYEFLVASDGSLKEVIMYYSKKVPKDVDNKNSEKVKPRLTITFSAFKKLQPNTNDNEFNEKKYFLKKGKKLVPVAQYKDFTLSDQRFIVD